MKSILSPNYKSFFTTTFPGEDSGNTTPRQTPGVLWSATPPTPVSDPKLIAWSDNLARELGIQKPQTKEEIAAISGNALAPGMKPYASAYAGHQFGNWAGQLGDGRAITLGEWVRPDGQTEELQLKGAGETAYSRRGDGRAVLRSSVREYLMSEAMHHLGIPTTRALSLVSTGDAVVRDMFYDGHPRPEPGAIVLRTAPTFIRFGHFELLYARQEFDLLAQLTGTVIEKHFSQLKGDDVVVDFYREVVRRTALLMVEWMRVGFVHGVMNTDNMSILGLTIDYGPYGMLDAYDDFFTPNTTDLPGRRYAFGNQPQIAKWNLANLGTSLSPLARDVDALAAALDQYDAYFSNAFDEMMLAKMGISTQTPESLLMVERLGELLQALQPDYTLFFQLLETLSPEEQEEDLDYFSPALYGEPLPETATQFRQFLAAYRTQFSGNFTPERAALMQKTNPRFILRNYQLHEAIEALEKGDDSLFRKLETALQTPYEVRFPELNHKQPQWALTRPGCGMLSCSS